MKKRIFPLFLALLLFVLSACDSPEPIVIDPDPIIYYRTKEIPVIKEKPVPVTENLEGQELYDAYVSALWWRFISLNYQTNFQHMNYSTVAQYALMTRSFVEDFQERDENEKNESRFYEEMVAASLSRLAKTEYDNGKYMEALGMMIELTAYQGAPDFSDYWQNAATRFALKSSTQSGETVIFGSWQGLPLFWRVQEKSDGKATLKSVFVVDRSTYRKDTVAPTWKEANETFWKEMRETFFEAGGGVHLTQAEVLALKERLLEIYCYHPEAKYWADSDLRTFLNTDFYENAFSPEEKKLLVQCETSVKEMGEATWDMVSVPTSDDRVGPTYFSTYPWFPTARQGLKTEAGVWLCKAQDFVRTNTVGHYRTIDPNLHCYVGLAGHSLSIQCDYNGWEHLDNEGNPRKEAGFHITEFQEISYEGVTGHPAEVNGVVPKIVVSLG